jgi:hypothetical protein
MHKPAHLMIAIGLPSAHGDGNREQDDSGDDGRNPAADATVGSIVHCLQQGGPSGVRDLRRFTVALEDLADAYMDKDRQGFEEAASEARDALNDLIEE